MNKRQYHIHRLCFAAVLFLCVFLADIGFTAPVRIVLMHTSDMHGHISAQMVSNDDDETKTLTGGFAALQSYVKQVRKETYLSGGLPILLDSGDFFQGTPIVDLTRGKCMIDLMNKLGYAIACIGNHDFDYGSEYLKTMIKQARFQVLACNLFDAASGCAWGNLRTHVSVPFKGMKIAFIGILTPDTVDISFEENLSGVVFKDPVPIVNDLSAKLRFKGVDFIVLLSHMGIQEDRRIAKQLSDIDLILGGHSHTFMKEMETGCLGEPSIVHSGADCLSVSKIEILLEKGKQPVLSHDPVVLSHPAYPPDPDILKVVEGYESELNIVMKEVIGISSVKLVRGIVGGDSPGGSFIADAMREFGTADFAFINYGGIRCSINPGEITRESIFFLQPFANTVEIMSLSGNEIIRLVEQSLSVNFSPINETDKEEAAKIYNISVEGLKREFIGEFGYIIPSNLQIEFDPERPAMKRILKVTDGSGRALDPDKTYTVAMSSYMSEGGDGFKHLKNIKSRKASTTTVRAAVEDKIIRDGGIKRTPEQRIFNIRLKTAPIR